MDQPLGIETVGPRQFHDTPDRGSPVSSFHIGRAASLQAEQSDEPVHDRGEAFDHAAGRHLEQRSQTVFRNDIGARRASKVEGVLGDDLSAD